MNIEDAENEMGINMRITKSAEKFNWLVTFYQVFGITILFMAGELLQEIFKFGNGIILWLIFASIFVTGKMLLGGQAMSGNVQSDILLAIYRELKNKNA